MYCFRYSSSVPGSPNVSNRLPISGILDIRAVATGTKAFSPGIFTGGPRVLQQGPETAKPSPIVDTPPGIADPQISGPTGISLSSTGASTEQALESSQLQRAKESIDKAAEKAGVKDQVQTFVNERGLTIRLNTDPYLFDPGSAVLHPEAKRLLVPITKMLKGTFGIGVMRTDGSGERRLTESFLDEGPTWAPNGRVIMFARSAAGGGSSIWSVDLTGTNLRRVPTPGEASDPAWSPDLDGPGIN